MTIVECIIDAYEKMQFFQEGLFELTVSNHALLSAMKECFPEVDYEKHHRAAMQTALAKGILDNIRETGEIIELMKKELKAKG